MLTLTVVGPFVVFLVFGASALPESTHFTGIVAALTGVAGAIIRFYFGSKDSGDYVSILGNPRYCVRERIPTTTKQILGSEFTRLARGCDKHRRTALAWTFVQLLLYIPAPIFELCKLTQE